MEMEEMQMGEVCREGQKEDRRAVGRTMMGIELGIKRLVKEDGEKGG